MNFFFDEGRMILEKSKRFCNLKAKFLNSIRNTHNKQGLLKPVLNVHEWVIIYIIACFANRNPLVCIFCVVFPLFVS